VNVFCIGNFEFAKTNKQHVFPLKRDTITLFNISVGSIRRKVKNKYCELTILLILRNKLYIRL